MDTLLKLKHLSIVSKVVQELQNHLGTDDKDLAEFIINLAQTGKSLEGFKQLLKENDANFNDQFVANLYRIINKMDARNTSKDDSKNNDDNKSNQKENNKPTIEEEYVNMIFIFYYIQKTYIFTL